MFYNKALIKKGTFVLSACCCARCWVRRRLPEVIGPDTITSMAKAVATVQVSGLQPRNKLAAEAFVPGTQSRQLPVYSAACSVAVRHTFCQLAFLCPTPTALQLVPLEASSNPLLPSSALTNLSPYLPLRRCCCCTCFAS